MPNPAGLCFIEYIWPAHGPHPTVLERFPFWTPEPDVAYLRGLAHAGIRSFYRAGHPLPEPILIDGVMKEVTAEALRLTDSEGHELCRWTAADEYEELSFPHREAGKVNRIKVNRGKMQ